jgi:hypothetical protein
MKALGGCVMELDDCAFPLLTKVVQTDKLEVKRLHTHLNTSGRVA